MRAGLGEEMTGIFDSEDLLDGVFMEEAREEDGIGDDRDEDDQ